MAQVETEYFRRNLAAICEGYGNLNRVAESAGISRGFISRVIHGKCTPNLEVAAQIAQGAGLTLSTMLRAPAEFSQEVSAKSA